MVYQAPILAVTLKWVLLLCAGARFDQLERVQSFRPEK